MAITKPAAPPVHLMTSVMALSTEIIGYDEADRCMLMLMCRVVFF